MFKQKTVKAFSIVALVLSIIGLLASILGVFFLKTSANSVYLYSGVVSWSFLLWASVIGNKLATSYKLNDEEGEYKDVGIGIYSIIATFILYFFVGFGLGLVFSVVILGRLWSLKRNYDLW
jgi:Na+/H+-translocating membrane pyrophosphatase